MDGVGGGGRGGRRGWHMIRLRRRCLGAWGSGCARPCSGGSQAWVRAMAVTVTRRRMRDRDRRKTRAAGWGIFVKFQDGLL